MKKTRIVEWPLAIGRELARFLMNHYTKLKPLFCWLSPLVRARIKKFILNPLFKNLYPPQTSSTQPVGLEKGACLIGYPRANIGEGEFLRQTAFALQQTCVKFSIYDYTVGIKLSQSDNPLATYAQKGNSFSTNIFHLKPDQIEASVVALGPRMVEGHYNIGYWLWELSKLPEEWVSPLKFLDEIWCPSRFVKSTIEKKSQKPVIYMPPAIELEEPEGFSRESFNLPKSPFLFLFVFDFKSYMSRKNPEACIKAFRQAFPSGKEEVGLLLKSMDGINYQNEFKTLAAEAASDPRVTLIDQTFTAQEILGLMQVCDCFVSLHRSEGIGLCMAQCMLLGKPVIATNYSGNTDFTLPDNSCLVDYKLIEVNKGMYPFAQGQVWAEPDIEQAADHMRRMAEDNKYRETISKAGQTYIKTHHNHATVGGKYRQRLEELGLI